MRLVLDAQSCFCVLPSTLTCDFSCLKSRTAGGRKNPNQVRSLTSSKMTGALGRCSRNEKRFFRFLSPTLPGDFSCLHPALRAAGKILTKYNAAH